MDAKGNPRFTQKNHSRDHKNTIACTPVVAAAHTGSFVLMLNVRVDITCKALFIYVLGSRIEYAMLAHPRSTML